MIPLGTPKGSQKWKKHEKRPFQNQIEKTDEKNTANEKEIVEGYPNVTPNVTRG